MVLPVSVQAGVFQNFIGTDSEVVSQEVEVIKTDSVLDVSVLTAATNPDPRSAKGGDEVIAQEGALISTGRNSPGIDLASRFSRIARRCRSGRSRPRAGERSASRDREVERRVATL